MIHGEDGIGAVQILRRKQRVGGKWADKIDSQLAHLLEDGFDSLDLFSTEMSAFASMGVQSAYEYRRLGDAELRS